MVGPHSINRPNRRPPHVSWTLWSELQGKPGRQSRWRCGCAGWRRSGWGAWSSKRCLVARGLRHDHGRRVQTRPTGPRCRSRLLSKADLCFPCSRIRREIDRLVARLRTRLRAIINELNQVSAKDDPRWADLGLDSPEAERAAKPVRERRAKERTPNRSGATGTSGPATWGRSQGAG